MPKKLQSLLLLTLLIAPTCRASDAGFSYGLIQPSCAPNDAGAVEITLSRAPISPKNAPTAPYVYINIWKDLSLHEGQVVKFDSRNGGGSASRCLKEGRPCDAATSAEVHIDKIKRGTAVTGHYELRFKNGETLSGAFEGTWKVDARVLCG